MEILPFMYLGNFQDASNLELLHRLGITSLMNVSTKCKNLFEDQFSYMNIPVDDNPNADLAAWFPESNAFIGRFDWTTLMCKIKIIFWFENKILLCKVKII